MSLWIKKTFGVNEYRDLVHQHMYDVVEYEGKYGGIILDSSQAPANIVSIKGEASRYTKQFYIQVLVLITNGYCMVSSELSPSWGRPAGTQNSFTFGCRYLLPMGTAWYKVNCLHQGGGQQVRKQLYILVTDTLHTGYRYRYRYWYK